MAKKKILLSFADTKNIFNFAVEIRITYRTVQEIGKFYKLIFISKVNAFLMAGCALYG